MDYELGCRLPREDWVWLNRKGIFDDPTLRQYVSPFPPDYLMRNVSGLEKEPDFASHGADFFIALSEASAKPLSDYQAILDFGCGCGRLARMFKGHPNNISGCDIDSRHIDWVEGNLEYVKAKLTSVHPPLPYSNDEFDAVFSISVFTHLNETSQDEFLCELSRISKKGANLFLTVHGKVALNRAIKEKSIREMIVVDDLLFEQAQKSFSRNEHAFIVQQGHLTTQRRKLLSLKNFFRREIIDEPYEYGITFVSEEYVRSHWSRWFDVLDYRHGAIHQFQDIVVLAPKK